MKTAFLAAALLAQASAFAPANQGSRAATSLNAEMSKALPFLKRPELLDGSMAGDVGFDPLGLSEINGVGVDLYWLREAEIKHCRIAMLAAAGNVWVEAFGPAPGCEAATAKNQMDAFWQLWKVHPQYIVAGLIFIMFAEAISGIACTSGRESGMRAPGDFGFNPFGYPDDEPRYQKFKEQEIANGRLAMFAAAGQIMQGMTTGQGALENFNSVFN
mmetsp:Transcript_28232/g.77527  ORF Transcript_28232/g.77527 Transcript_28232/m.77527 type:complete len:216 (+) Transcript_28232:57-704(+)|eukprot:CAMPEP_0168753976 /NCGR_PEP_ID=MMETSP0724-20121128/19254_1 /TAXON_ID=265536 /ORGANISM="Amphiprora sp., Strain CCMP467" /LENGTH=215 /DNA_ID=CAMNT_0008802423 /DNA_START=35 /DNA_END=682 /DNA_ORIENTATION=-